ncbi:hypothetical protein CG723_41960 [Streptomyces sp. CB01635]|nr:hypothetical protein CG723_41960 [Streptomyces sp. CB01635]
MDVPALRERLIWLIASGVLDLGLERVRAFRLDAVNDASGTPPRTADLSAAPSSSHPSADRAD